MATAVVPHKIVLLTGLSGAGKSTATKSLEDIGFRTIDNLPNDLIPALLEKIQLQPDRFARLCLVIDARDGDPRAAIDAVRAASSAVGTESRVIYLDSRDDVLIRRFSETRHRHPLGGPIDAPSDVAGAGSGFITWPIEACGRISPNWALKCHATPFMLSARWLDWFIARGAWAPIRLGH